MYPGAQNRSDSNPWYILVKNKKRKILIDPKLLLRICLCYFGCRFVQPSHSSSSVATTVNSSPAPPPSASPCGSKCSCSLTSYSPKKEGNAAVISPPPIIPPSGKFICFHIMLFTEFAHRCWIRPGVDIQNAFAKCRLPHWCLTF